MFCFFHSLLFLLLFQKQETHRTMAHSFATIKSKQQKYIINMHTHTQGYMYVYAHMYISRFVNVCVFVGAALRKYQLNTQANRIILNSVEQYER